MRKSIIRFISCIITSLFIFECHYMITEAPNGYSSALGDDVYSLCFNHFQTYTDLTTIQNNAASKTNYNKAALLSCSSDTNALGVTNELPNSFTYRDVNENALKAYLAGRSSVLKDEPYFSSIISVGKSFNINPILLFAITGQEQGFVPQGDVSASIIANNPYNVFYSWQNYNTDIVDSSEIACRTIINLSKNRPVSVDPFVWVNQKYSSDQNWHLGVRNFYNEITSFISEYEKRPS